MTVVVRSPVVAALAALALALVGACSNGSGATPSATASSTAVSTSASPSASAAPHVAEIAVLSSDTGPLGSTGRSVRAAVELAVEEANSTGLVPGWSFEVVAANDRSKQSAGQQAAAGLAADPDLIGVVGTLRSTIDEGVQPILNSAGLPMISPAGTATQLTRRSSSGGVVRPFPTYFRLSPTDADQGPAAARYAARELDAERVAVVSDGTSYGALLTSGFTAEAKRLGVRRPVVRKLALDPNLPRAQALAQRAAAATEIKKADVDAVFFGGSAIEAAAFAQALSTARVTAPLIGGDVLLDGQFVTKVGPRAGDGTYAVFPGAAPELLKTSRALRELWQQEHPDSDAGPYSANTYDAARALLLAFRDAIGTRTKVSRSVRDDVVARLDELSMSGATGKVAFDEFGDAIDTPLSMYRFVDGAWQPAAAVRLR